VLTASGVASKGRPGLETTFLCNYPIFYAWSYFAQPNIFQLCSDYIYLTYDQYEQFYCIYLSLSIYCNSRAPYVIHMTIPRCLNCIFMISCSLMSCHLENKEISYLILSYFTPLKINILEPPSLAHLLTLCHCLQHYRFSHDNFKMKFL